MTSDDSKPGPPSPLGSRPISEEPRGAGDLEDACRLPLVDQPTGPAVAVFDELLDMGLPISNLYRVLANAPAILRAWTDLTWPLREAGAPRSLRELAITYLGIRRESEYVRVHHRRYALDQGIPSHKLDLLEGLALGGPSEEFSEVERVVLGLVDDLVEGNAATAERVRRLRELFSDEEVVEIVVTVSIYEAVCAVNRSLAVPLEEWSRIVTDR